MTFHAQADELTFWILGIEDPPLDSYVAVDVGGEPAAHLFVIPRYTNLREPWLDPFNEVVRAHDACRCWSCGTVIGYHLDDQDITRWRPVFLIHTGTGPVAWVCEDCIPQIPAVRWEEQTHE